MAEKVIGFKIQIEGLAGTIETATQKIEGDQVFNTYKDEVSGNEALDIEVGCLAALRLHPRNWDAMSEEILYQTQESKADPRPSPMRIASLGGMRF